MTEPTPTEPGTEPEQEVSSELPADVEAPKPEDKEAVRYRRKLRQTESERDSLTDRLTTLQRAEVERLAAEHLADGADLWRDGAQLAEVLNDDGDVDRDKVAELAKTLLDAHKHWRKPAPAAPPASTVTANGKIAGPAETEVTWTDVLTKSKREQLEQRRT